MNRSDIKKLLADHGLPVDMAIHELVDARFAGRYIPTTDVLELPAEPNRFTVLHEGAHAEHWEKLGCRGSSDAQPHEFLVGALLASEVYVGRRLAAVPGFANYERAEIKTIPGLPDTFVDIAERFDSAGLFIGAGGGSLMMMEGMKFIARLLPLLGIELESNEPSFFLGLSASPTFPGLMQHIVLKLAGLKFQELADRARVSEVGTEVLKELEAVEIRPVTLF